MSTSIFIYTSILAICFSFVVAAPSDCRARYESWFDSSKTVGSFGFTLQNNSESLLLYSFGNILYSPPPFDYYTNVNSFITYSDAGSPAAGMPVFAPAEPPFLFFDARALIIRRNGLISISSVSSTWNLGQSSTSSSTYIVSINEVYPGSSLNNFAGLIVKDGSVSVSSISVVCA
eukprot:TRINITY_DN4180_c0_g1_i3.p1 TRINITY_DN4180_c0_g1~~TRINITY_DN4180_c0_g1_i3.p1  ORF type:complete len:175 (-),score=31.98 TRINITY_DN4180_c0_g1_i3:39-563(-)